jgi:hypothetical protein
VVTTRQWRAIGVVATALVALYSLLLPHVAIAQGCSMCKTALDGPPDPLTQAFNVSSILLMAAPYTLVGIFAAWIVVATRRRDREAARAESTADYAVSETE